VNLLLIDKIDLLRKAFKYTKQRRSFRMDAVVILPDHSHSIAWPVSVPYQPGISAVPGSQMQEVEHPK
jgi:REP element-mobilizing transposase RayT